MRYLLAVAVFTLGAATLTGCGWLQATGDTVEATGEGVGHAVEETGQAVSRAADETEDEVDEAM